MHPPVMQRQATIAIMIPMVAAPPSKTVSASVYA